MQGELPEEPASSEPANSAPVASVATHTRTIGIIHPPSDVRTIVDKTAQFVAKNGPEFEKRILANNTWNAKFSFLSSSDPYHAYYQHRILEFRAQLQSSAQQTTPSQPADSAAPEAGAAAPPADGKEEAKPDALALYKPPVHKVLEELSDSSNNDGRNLPGPAPPLIAGVPSVRSIPPPPGLALNIPLPRKNIDTFSKGTWWQEAINGTLPYSDQSSLDWKSSSLICTSSLDWNSEASPY